MRDGTAQLRLDRRLARRRGWITQDELEKELAALPDVADKAELLDLPSPPSDPEDESETPQLASEPEGGSGLH